MISHSNINQALALNPTHPACDLYPVLYDPSITPIKLGIAWNKARANFIERLNEMNFYKNSNDEKQSIINILEHQRFNYSPHLEKLLLRLISVIRIAKDIYPTSSQIISEIFAALELNQLEFLNSSLEKLKKDFSSLSSMIPKNWQDKIHNDLDQVFILLAARIEHLKASNANLSFELPFFELNNSAENTAIDSTSETATSTSENQIIDLTNEPEPVTFSTEIEFNPTVFSLTSSHTSESSFSLLNSQLSQRKATNKWLEMFWESHRKNFLEAFKNIKTDSLTMTIICAEEKLAPQSIEELIINLALNVNVHVKNDMNMRLLNTILTLLNSKELVILQKSFFAKSYHLINTFFQPAPEINLTTQLTFLNKLIVFVSGLKMKRKVHENPLANRKSSNPYLNNDIAQAIDEANTPTTSAPRPQPRAAIKATHPRQNPHSFHATQQRGSRREPGPEENKRIPRPH